MVDIALRVMVGRLCHLGLGLCNPDDAPSGLLDFTDQTYQGADQFDDAFPYLRMPLPVRPIRIVCLPPTSPHHGGSAGLDLFAKRWLRRHVERGENGARGLVHA